MDTLTRPTRRPGPVDGPAGLALSRLAAARRSPSFVVAQIGQSLDGRIATTTGESRYINGPAALRHLHALRAHVDAVVVGAGTVAADDPRLDVRRTTGDNPARVVIDPTGRTLASALWLREDGARRLLVTSLDAQAPAAAEVIRLPLVDGAFEPRAILRTLAERGLRMVLIEGGQRTLASFIDAGCVDRLHLLMSCIILGSGVAGLALRSNGKLAAARRPRTDVYPLGGGDILFDCDLEREHASA